MFDDIIAAIPFGIILAFTIGPVFFVLLETSATKGFKAAIVFDLGVVLADIIFVTVAFFSTSKLIETFKKDSNFLILGGVLLVFYGVISFIKTSKSFRSIVKEYQKVKIQKNYACSYLSRVLFKLYKYWCSVRLAWLYSCRKFNHFNTTGCYCIYNINDSYLFYHRYF